ncbi:mixed lineage kinase domain-like protein [Hemicordylus capensis]|uniref:mixed lineage kinase domain-like protein n=1 Tax=Hemicordylus capensis TaxID=884348 RepID=UPI0023049B06|nr:mixed lineage kinase domain-like protein [Hemicordylus capensis]
MEIVENILAAAKIIYKQCKQVKCCGYQSQRLEVRIKALLPSIEALQAQSAKQISPRLKETLQTLLDNLHRAKELLVKYSDQNQLQKFVKANNVVEKFAEVNEGLNDAFQALLLLLQVEQSTRAQFERDVLHKEDRHDQKMDSTSWEEMLQHNKEIKDRVDSIRHSVKSIESKLEQVLTINTAESLPKKKEKQGSNANCDIKEIDRKLLTRGKRLMGFESHLLFRGEYNEFPVAIKVFNNPASTSKKVREIFEQEVKTMKTFESPCILRLYGICIDESVGPTPTFSIVMEYCEKGTLREVLKREPHLSWKVRMEMAHQASIGLHGLHQTQEKTHLHGCINSTKFLVAAGYRVKLTGFELSRTESSIRRKPKETHKEVAASAYICPEGLASIHHQYDLPSEIYSFGIVLWEIATGKIPFEGCTAQEIQEKVCEQRYQEPLGKDCPDALQDIINQCRNYDPSMRPSSKDIVSNLRAATSTTTA